MPITRRNRPSLLPCLSLSLPFPLPRPLHFSSVLLLLCFSSIIQANESEEYWYQIELCIFTNDDSNSAQKEQWRQDISLAYPRPLILLREKTTTALSPDEEALKPAELLSETQNYSSLTDTPSSTEFPAESFGSSISQSTAFTLLPEEEFKLTDAVKRMSRSGKHRILRHIAWRQPIKNRKEAEHIAISGGIPYGEHFELEGSLKLFRERYLHIETNLWLSTFATNLGQETVPWPILPNPPFQESQELSQTDQDAGFQLQDSADFGSQFQAFLNTEYIVERVVTLKQRRKMRSKELHYLDHPLFGMLIEITPYDPQAAKETDEQPTEINKPIQ